MCRRSDPEYVATVVVDIYYINTMEVGLELCNVELCAVDKMYLFCVRFQIFSSEQSSVGIAFFDIC